MTHQLHACPRPWEVIEDELVPALSPEILFGTLLRLERGQDRWTACCPFHDDHTPSFIIDPSRLRWHCQAGCGGGGPVQYYQKHYTNLSWVEAARELCQLAEISPEIIDIWRDDWTEQEFRIHDELERKSAILESFLDFCKGTLLSSNGTQARAYLVSRGIPEEKIDELNLGLYTTPVAAREHLRTNGYSMEDAEALGCFLARWSSRIVAPWCDEKGKVINVWARIPGETPRGHRVIELMPRENQELPFGSRDVPYMLDKALAMGVRDLLLVDNPMRAILLYSLGLTDPFPIAAGGDLTAGQIASLEMHLRQEGSLTICCDYDPRDREKWEDPTTRIIKRLSYVSFRIYVVDPVRLTDSETLEQRVDVNDFITRWGGGEIGLQVFQKLLEDRIHSFRYQAQTIVRKIRTEEEWTDSQLLTVIDKAMEFDASVGRDKLPELDRFFWSEILEATGANWRALEARREALASKRVREQEQQNHADLVHEVSLLLRSGNFEAAKTKLREGVELLRGQEERLRTEPILCVADELQGHEDRLEQMRHTGYCGFDTRTFPQLDAATRGLRDFIVLRGGSGAGKSALALQIGMDIVATNREACFLMVSLDINRWQMLSRIKCRQARMDWDTLVFGSQKVGGQGREAWFTREECEALDTAERKLTSIGRRVHILDRQNFPELTVSSLLEQAGELKSRARAQKAFIVVDHLDLWPADPKTVLVQTEEEARRARLASLKTFREANPDDTLMVIDNSLREAPGIGQESHGCALNGGPTPDLALSLYELSTGERASLMRHLMGEEAEAGQDDSDETGVIYEKLVVSAGREAVRRSEIFLGFNFRTFYFEEVPLTMRPA